MLEERFRLLVQRAREARVLGTVPDVLERQDEHPDEFGIHSNALEETLQDHGVGSDRKVRTVLLDGGDGKDRHRCLGIQVGELIGAKVGPGNHRPHDTSALECCDD